MLAGKRLACTLAWCGVGVVCILAIMTKAALLAPAINQTRNEQSPPKVPLKLFRMGFTGGWPTM
ncbi:hypothetical protein [Mesorhizobium sp. M0684]|uniref:hypothetical protein n=1 Tax=unclassified Mesorhizobium TaxID=325217 RepID=UPI003339BCC7